MPIGTPITILKAELGHALANYGYQSREIKLSKLLEGQAGQAGHEIAAEPKIQRAGDLMRFGDKFCEENADAAAVARLGMHRIQEESDKNSTNKRAWILDSLKRPKEIELLEEEFGDRLFIISAKATIGRRHFELSSLLSQELYGSPPEEIEARVRDLIRNDLDGSISSPSHSPKPYSQDILKTFPQAHLFVDVEGDVKCQIGDVIDLIFDNPRSRPPTIEEYGMHLAWSTSMLSAEMGLRVGAALMQGHHIIGTGFNSHPFLETAPNYDPSPSTISNMTASIISALDGSDMLSSDLKEELASGDENALTTVVQKLLSGPLKNTPITSITEYQPPIHAEMNALLDALQHTTYRPGGTLYVTDYPCHNCAKHLLRLDLNVIYLQPYPKSRAEAMYGTVATGRFTPFTGVSPKRYAKLFSSRSDRKTPSGSRIEWDAKDYLEAAPKLGERTPG